MKITSITGHMSLGYNGIPSLECRAVLDHKYTVNSQVKADIYPNHFFNLKEDVTEVYYKSIIKSIKHIKEIIAPEFLRKEPNAIKMDLKLIEISSYNKDIESYVIQGISKILYKAQALNENIKLFKLIAYAHNSDAVMLPFPITKLIDHPIYLIQKLMIVPAGKSSFRESLDVLLYVFNMFNIILNKAQVNINIKSKSSNDFLILDVLNKALYHAYKKYDYLCMPILYINADKFYDPKSKLYKFNINNKVINFTSDNLIEHYQNIVNKYQIYSIIEPISTQDIKGYKDITRALSNKVNLVFKGDNTQIIKDKSIKYINKVHTLYLSFENKATISEILQNLKVYNKSSYNLIISTDYESTDSFLADLSVGAGINYLSFNNFNYNQHLSIFNKLLSIEDYLSNNLIDA